MAREFNDDASFINSEEFQNFYNALKNINYKNTSMNPTPPAKEGALWLNNDELKFCKDNLWSNIFGNKFKITDEIINDNQPDASTSVPGQIWINKNNDLLMYFNGITYVPIKATSTDLDYNSLFSDFLINGPMNPLDSSYYIPDNTTPYCQFLVPNAKIDKIFGNGILEVDGDKISDIAVKFKYDDIKEKEIISIHASPERLMDIKKYIFKITPPSDPSVDNWAIENRYIDIELLNIEVYGFSNGFGTLLRYVPKSNDTDYKPYQKGILLSTEVAKQYDFIVAIKYIFGESKKKGTCELIHKNVKDNTNGIYIGDIDDNNKPILFVDGVATYSELKSYGINPSYSYNSNTGFLTINGSVHNSNLTVLTFYKKIEGLTKDAEQKDNKNIIYINNISKQYNKPLLFLNGIALSQDLNQFTYDKTNNKITISYNSNDIEFNKIKNKGIPYILVETMDNIVQCKMYSKSGFVEEKDNNSYISYTSDNTTDSDIPMNTDEMFVQPILFIKGLLIPSDQIKYNTNNSLTVNYINKEMPYILLKDMTFYNPDTDTIIGNRIRYDGYSFDITIPYDNLSTALVYGDGKLVLNSEFGLYYIKPDDIKNNQIIKLNNKWIYYKDNIENTITNPDLINLLELSINQYILGSNSINISNNITFDNIDCYAYKFGNYVEEKLLTSEFDTKKDILFYNMFYMHQYDPNTNELSVFLNGIKQYSLIEDNSNLIHLDGSSIDGIGNYIIEKTEGNEQKSCEKIILDYRNKISGTNNIFRTNISLSPGNLKIFIGGLRQPNTSYTLLDPYTIQINGNIIGGENDFNLDMNNIYKKPEVFYDENNIPIIKYHNVQRYDIILIEKRTDYSINEITVPFRLNAQGTFSLAEDKIPIELFYSSDLLTIYIDGILFDCRELLKIERDKKEIYLINKFETIDKKPINNKYIIHQAKPDKDFITFEWR